MNSSTRARLRATLAVSAAACVLLAACGSDNKASTTTAASAASTPTTAAAAATTAKASTTSAAGAGSAAGSATTSGGSTPVTGSAPASSNAVNPNLAIPADETNPNGYGQDDKNKNLYHGAGGFTIDTSDCPSDWNATQGIKDGTIKLFTALPLSGPIASVGIYGQGMKSYFDYLNANGGINGMKVELDLNDNQYLPDLTKTIADQAVADGTYFGSVGINGTPQNLAIWDSLNDECMPMILTGSGAAQWGDVQGHPWTGPGETFAYVAESRVQAEWLKTMLPKGGKVATITINNDFGKQYLAGLQEGLKGSNITIVDTEYHEPAAANLDNEFTTVRATNADALVLESSGTFCTQALAALEKSDWKPIFLLPTACGATSIMQPLIDQGLTGNGAYLVQSTTAANDPSVADTPFIKAYNEFLPTVNLDPKSTAYAGGWQFAWAATEVLKIASTYKGGLNRANVMLAHRAMDQPLPLLLPGLSYKTFGDTDQYLFEGGQVAQYVVTDPKATGTFKPVGDLINFEGQLGTYDELRRRAEHRRHHHDRRVTATAPTPSRPGAGTPAAPPLAGVRVLELGDTIAAAYAGRLLADLGADVVQVEPPGGDALRHRGPYVGAAHPERSAAFAYFAAGKRSVVADPSAEEGRATIAALARVADVVVQSTARGDRWLDDEALADAESAAPGLISASISTWGSTVADRSTVDLIALAAGGLLSVNGTNVDASKGTPVRYRGEFSSIHAACDAVLAVLGALHARLVDGRGQRIDVSAQAATASILATAVATWLYAGQLPVRDGARGVVPWGFFECADGFVLLQVTEDPQWFNLRRIIGEPEWAQPDVFDTNAMRSELQDIVHSLLAGELTRFTVEEFLDACQREGVAAARVQDAVDLLAWPHLRARDYFTPIELAGVPGAAFEAPTPPWRYAGTPRPGRRVSPALGAHTAEVLADWQPRPVVPVTGDVGRGPAPLAGLRVVDMTWVWAGPFAATQFAHLGADVVKFESTSRVDVTRRLGPFADGEVGIDRSGYFNQYNQGKRSVVLDVKDRRGLALLEEVVAAADLIIDNMRPGSLARMGLDMDELRRLNPNIVAVAMSGFGEDGPERDRMAYGSIIDALSGVAASNGAPGGGPTDFPMSLPDPAAGIHAAIAGVAALYRVRRGGPGERVEASMLEATLSAFPWPVLIEASGSGPVVCEGNRDETMSPHGTFRCAGADEWVAVVVPDDAAFAHLADAIGSPHLAADPCFATLAARKANEDELEELVGAWTATRTREEAAAALQRGGVLAEPVRKMDEVAASAVLTARGFLQYAAHRELGVRPLPGPAWVASRSPMRTTAAAPCFGEHTREVLAEVVGLSPEEIDALDAAGLLR